MTAFDEALAAVPTDPRPQPKRDRWGRYLIAGKPYTRATTIADTLDNRHNLELWQQRMVAKGLTVRDDLHALASTLHIDTDRQELNRVCAQAIDAAKTVDKAGLGTALHRMTEAVDDGADIATVPTVWRPHIETYQQTLDSHGIEIDRTGIERIVVYGHPDAETRIAGTADRLPVTWHGRRYVADLKTGANLAWSWQSISIQMAIYANHNHLYDPATDQLSDREEVDTERAIIIHLPAVLEQQVKPRCDLYMIDITAGHRALLTALEVREWRSTKNLATPFGSLHAEGAPQDVGGWFRQRGTVIAGNPQALTQLRALWPDTVPQPLPDLLTDAQTADLDRVMAAVEADHQLAFPTAMPGTVKPKTRTRTKTKDNNK